MLLFRHSPSPCRLLTQNNNREKVILPLSSGESDDNLKDNELYSTNNISHFFFKSIKYNYIKHKKFHSKFKQKNCDK